MMGFATKFQKTKGMGLLLVFFPEDSQSAMVDNTKLLISSSSPSSSSSAKITAASTSTSSKLLNKAQSVISLCALLVFFSLLVFTLSSFEPTNYISAVKSVPNRRFLSQKNPIIGNYSQIPVSRSSWFSAKIWRRREIRASIPPPLASALQGMGTLYRRGTKSMNDVVVCHVVEDVNEDEFRLFLRVLHRSGITSKSDVVFVFPSSTFSSRFSTMILEENDSFMKLIDLYREVLLMNRTSRDSGSSFDVTQFMRKKKRKEEVLGGALWGIKSRRASFNESDGEEGESTRVSYGSVVSFEATELDPENLLSGFLNLVPMSLRRWACYSMLLGRVRHNFKHIMLVDVKQLLILGDPLGRVRNRSSESVYLSTKPSKHSRKNPAKTESNYPVNSAIITGGARGVRRLSSAMVVEIVRGLMQHKRKNSVTESGILSQLVSNEFILKNVNLIKSTESIPELSSLTGLNSKSDHKVLLRGNSNKEEVKSVIMKLICASELDSSVYNDC